MRVFIQNTEDAESYLYVTMFNLDEEEVEPTAELGKGEGREFVVEPGNYLAVEQGEVIEGYEDEWGGEGEEDAGSAEEAEAEPEWDRQNRDYLEEEPAGSRKGRKG